MRLRRIVVFLALFLGFQNIRAYGQVVATWTDSSGNWSNPANWSTNPVVPNNTDTTRYSATINVPGSIVTMDVSVTLNNLTLGTGNLLIGSPILVSGTSNNFGTLITSGQLQLFGSSASAGVVLNNNAGANLVNSGTITTDGAIISNSGVFTNSGLVQGDVAVLNNNGTLINAAGGSIFYDNGGVNNASGALILNNGGYFCDQSHNAGTFINNGSLFISPFIGNFAGSGTLINTGTFGDSGAFSGGFFKNTGAVTIDGVFGASYYKQTAGSTLVDGTMAGDLNIRGGTMGGSGTINGNVVMGGVIMPGDAPGTLTILGNYEQTGTGIFDELMSPYAQSFLDVSGNVVLHPGAALEISLLGGFNPLGDTISIMDFSTLSGRFANGSSFWDDGFLWDITYRQHDVDVTAVQAPEPGTLSLLGVALIGLALYWCRNSARSLRCKRPC